MITKTLVKNSLAIFVGIFFGVLLHYCLYRFSLPAKPFIYVSF